MNFFGHPVLLSCLVAFMFVAQAGAQVAYQDGNPSRQRANEGPDAQVPGWYYNLVITGKGAT